MCQSSNQYSHSHEHLQSKVNKIEPEDHSQESAANLIPKLETIDSLATQQQYTTTTKMHSTNVNSNAFINVNYHTQSNILKNNSVDDLANNDSMAFFNETLELSQEDIQKTLSANMPINANANNNRRNSTNQHDTTSIRENILHHASDEDGNGGGTINPMDFIDNCDDGNIDVVPSSVHDDDVFVNLDAFDMFVEFPELDLDAKSSLSCPTDNNIIDMVSDDVADSIHMAQNLERESHIKHINDDIDNQHVNDNGNRHMSTNMTSSTHFTNQITDSDSHNDLFNISDFSPEWAYPEGGIKVLVTGPWNHSSSNYTVLFDSFPVPTTIVQSGVLRCYCPAHEVGLVTLQVACDGYVISNSCIFEYKSPMNAENGSACDGTTNITSNGENLYKFTLFNRLESIEERMQIKMEPSDSVCITFYTNTL